MENIGKSFSIGIFANNVEKCLRTDSITFLSFSYNRYQAIWRALNVEPNEQYYILVEPTSQKLRHMRGNVIRAQEFYETNLIISFLTLTVQLEFQLYKMKTFSIFSILSVVTNTDLETQLPVVTFLNVIFANNILKNR